MSDPVCPVTPGQDAAIDAVFAMMQQGQSALPRPRRVDLGDAQGLVDIGCPPDTLNAGTELGFTGYVEELRHGDEDGFTLFVRYTDGTHTWERVLAYGPRSDMARPWRLVPPPTPGV